MHHEAQPPESSSATWRDQLIELDLPGLGPITASADPALWEPPPDGPAHEVDDEEQIGCRCRR